MHLIEWHFPSIHVQKLIQRFGENLELLSYKQKMQLRFILITYISHSLTLDNFTIFQPLGYLKIIQLDRTLEEILKILENIGIREAEDFLGMLQNLSMQNYFDKNDLNQNIIKSPHLRKISEDFGSDLNKFDYNARLSLRIACTAFLYCNNALKTELSFEDSWDQCIRDQPLEEELFCYDCEDFLEVLETLGINETEIFLQWLQRETRNEHAKFTPGYVSVNGEIQRI